MNVLWMLLVPAIVARPLGRHKDQFRDPRRRDPRRHEGRRESPHLESRDEYELTHDTGSPHLESRCEYEKRHVSA